jgi:hypothetical protein
MLKAFQPAAVSAFLPDLDLVQDEKKTRKKPFTGLLQPVPNEMRKNSAGCKGAPGPRRPICLYCNADAISRRNAARL